MVVPARDEEDLIGACVRSLCAQRGIDGLVWEILLILDGCTDRTAERAREALDRIGGPALHEVPVDGIGAGRARALGMNLACGRLLGAGAPDGLIATTDADTRVDPDWLANQIKALAAGAEAVGGRIELGDDAVLLDEATLSERADRHAARMATIGDDAKHPFFGGASIGISARAYESVGGMEPLIALEDEAFERRLGRARLRIARPADVRVITSARTAGRAPRGLATDLALSEWGRRRTWVASASDEDGDRRDQGPDRERHPARARGGGDDRLDRRVHRAAPGARSRRRADRRRRGVSRRNRADRRARRGARPAGVRGAARVRALPRQG